MRKPAKTQTAFPGWRDSLLSASIATVQQYAPDGPYWGCFSGGKDSVVLKRVVEMAGVDVEWVYNVTTIDPPELVQFIRDEHPDVRFLHPKRSFFSLARTKGFPTRVCRWCCEKLKESRSPSDRRILLGIRSAESPARAKRWRLFTRLTKPGSNVSRGSAVSPILHWKVDDVWSFIHNEGLAYCSLYDEGFKRLGCIGCPQAGPKMMKLEFARWPKHEKAWKKLFEWTWNRRTGSLQRDGRIWFGDRFFTCWEEMWEWWLNDEPLDKEECQGTMELFS